MAKILLAEDDLFLRDIYTEVLKGEGFEVEAAIDGEETLTKIISGGWDLVLLDVFMPKMNGTDVLRRLEAKDPHLYAKHIVFMTNTDNTKEFEAVSNLTDGYILKSSVDPGQLVGRVKQFLKK